MAFFRKLQKTFYEDLKNLSLFDEAVKLVKETYILEVVVNEPKTEFKIKANGTELFEFVETLLKSWLERKKKNQSVKYEDKIKETKENPFSDIFDGQVVWIFLGDLASKLSSEKYREEADKLFSKLVKKGSVVVDYEKEGRVPIMCSFETFKDVKSKVEILKLLVAPDSNDTSCTDGSKGNSSQDCEDREIKGKDDNGESVFYLTAGSDNQNKSEKLEASTDNGENLKKSALRQSEGASGGGNLSPCLGRSDYGSDQLSHSSGSKDKSTGDNKFLFCTSCGKTKVFVYEESIVKVSGVEAIVNAANERLDHAGGVAYHISKAAGGVQSKLAKECQSYIKKNGQIAVSKNFTSSAGKMPYNGVIHAVGPMWSEYKVQEDCAKDLCMTIINVLEEADKKKFSKIALPAISSGIYGVPKRLCAEMYIRGVIDYDSRNPQTQVREIHFVDISKDILQEIKDAYGRWKQNDKSLDFKNANSYTSISERDGSSSQSDQTVHPQCGMRQNPSVPQLRGSSKIPKFKLSETCYVKVYKCSIVEVKDVDAIACAVNQDFSINHRKVARIIKEHAGPDYDKKFKGMVQKLGTKSRQDVLICEAGDLAKLQRIKYVIHIALREIKSIKDMHRLEHLYTQIFENAKEKNMSKIALPLIGAANLQDAGVEDIRGCSQVFVETLRKVVMARGNDLTVKEVHFVDVDDKIISFVVEAFEKQGISDSEMQDQQRRSLAESVSAKTSGNPKMDLQAPRPGNGVDWLKKDNKINPQRSVKVADTPQAAEKCIFPNCNRSGTKKKYLDCGHVVCPLCFISAFESECPVCKPVTDQIKVEKKATTKEKASKEESNSQSEETENCPICMDTLTDPKRLSCGHKFHAECIDKSMEYKSVCPICGTVMGKFKGNQPKGKMFLRCRKDIRLQGYEDCDTIEISYDFSDGTQGDNHPHPGRPYKGTKRKAFLPDNPEGRKVRDLLQVAFKRDLIFTIGESRTTGKTDIVTWNDIHHKTKTDGGPTNFGYPDKTYLNRVQEELAAKGVTEKDLDTEGN